MYKVSPSISGEPRVDFSANEYARERAAQILEEPPGDKRLSGSLPDFPNGTKFYDVEFQPVAEFPDRTCVAYSETFWKDGKSRPFPFLSKAFASADNLTREQFLHWLRTGEGVWANAAHQHQEGKR